MLALESHKYIDKIVRSARKTIGIEINKVGQVIVRAPKSIPLDTILKFVSEKKSWIDKHKSNIVQKNLPERNFTEGETILFKGIEYPLKIVNNVSFALKFDEKNFYLSNDCVDLAANYFRLWFKQRAKIYLRNRTIELADKHKFKFNNIRVTSADTRWGSCNSRKNINFSWKLIMAPLPTIDYVIIHELSHTLEMNHSDKFWSIVEAIIPDHRFHRNWLKEHGYKLDI